MKIGASDGPSPQRLEGSGSVPYLPQGIEERAMPLLYSVFRHLASGSVGESILLQWSGGTQILTICLRKGIHSLLTLVFTPRLDLFLSVSSLLRLRE